MNRRSNKWLYLIIYITVALVTASCDRKTVYHHYEHTPLEGWEKDDTLFFSTERMPQEAALQRDIELRMADSYPFRNLSLIIEQTTLPSCHTQRDTLDCPLITPDGKILGQGITLYQYRFRLPDISVSEGDSLKLKIYHNMRRETLTGIADIGVRLMTY